MRQQATATVSRSKQAGQQQKQACSSHVNNMFRSRFGSLAFAFVQSLALNVCVFCSATCSLPPIRCTSGRVRRRSLPLRCGRMMRRPGEPPLRQGVPRARGLPRGCLGRVRRPRSTLAGPGRRRDRSLGTWSPATSSRPRSRPHRPRGPTRSKPHRPKHRRPRLPLLLQRCRRWLSTSLAARAWSGTSR